MWRPGLFIFRDENKGRKDGIRGEQEPGDIGSGQAQGGARGDRSRGIDDLLLWFTDLEGHLKSFSITISETEGALDDGMGFDGSSITGFNAIEESDMVAIPDPTTFQMPARRQGKVGRMICDVVTPDGTPYDGDPRYVLRRALERMEAMGFDTFNVGPELEYFLFRDDKGTETLDEGGYFAQTTMDAATGVRRDTIRALESMGIPVEYHHHEVGPSQHEIDIRYTTRSNGRLHAHVPAHREGGREAARLLRDVHAEAAVRRERLGHAHAHVALHGRTQHVLRRQRQVAPLRDGEGVHRRPAPPRARAVGRVRAVGQLVQAARAGLRGARSTSRGRSGTAPRSIRIPLYKPGSEQATRAEIRCPDPACNPYLTFAALLHAGLEGIEQGYELPDPMETNLYHLTPEQRRERGIVSLPETLGEAVDVFSQSELMKKALGPHIFDRYVELKRKEWDEYRVQLTEWEMKKYLAVL